MRFQRAWIVVFLFVGTAVSAPAGAVELEQLAEEISADRIRRHVMVLGSDALEGRAPGSRGGERAAGYLKSELDKLGLEPMGDDGGFFQQVPLHGNRPRPSCRLAMTSLGETAPLVLGEDYLLVTTGEQTLLPRPTPMVFVGFGIVAPEFDYSDYADVDVRGKVVVFLDGEPASDDPDYFGGREPSVYASVEAKQRIALSRGAVGSVQLAPERPGPGWWERQRRTFSFEHVTAAASIPRHLSLILHPDHAPGLFSEALFDLDEVRRMAASHRMRSFHLPVQLQFSGEFDTRSFLSPNVVGLIRGSDSELAVSYVVVSAHYDHLGVGPEVDGDRIYNGVVDNSLGVAGVLEIARVLTGAQRRPRRSILILLTTAEEAGNLGSEYFLEHSSIEARDLVANINIDGLAFFEAFSDVIGIGGELSDLGGILARAVEPLGLEVTSSDDLIWTHTAFARSDQAAFARSGVPSILVNEGFSWESKSFAQAVHENWNWFETRYHSPADDLDQPLDFNASRQHLGAILALVWSVADHPREPRWKPGSPYAYERLLSLSGR